MQGNISSFRVGVSAAFAAGLILLSVGSPANANAITELKIPGDFFQVGATWDRPNGNFTVYSFGGRDGLTNGYVTSSAGLNFTFTCPDGFIQCGLAGFVPQSGLFVSNMVDEDFADYGYVGSLDGSVSLLLPNWQFADVDRDGNYIGSNFGTFRAAYGTLADLLLGNFNELPLGGGDSGATGRVVTGNFRCSFNGDSTGFNGGPRCYNGTTEIPLADRLGFHSRGYDPQSGFLYGSRGGCAGWLDVRAGGTFTAVPGVPCGGSTVTSIVNGRVTIGAGLVDYFYRPATGQVVTAAAFNNFLQLQALSRNVGVGDALNYGLAGQGSSGFNFGTFAAYEAGFGPAAIPEPATGWVAGVALVGLALWRRRGVR